MTCQRLFVYGTLRPGRAPACVAPIVAEMRVFSAATIRGRLYDIGAFPGVILDDSAGVVHGVVLDGATPESLARLDAYEGCDPGDSRGALYVRRRAQVALASGERIEAWVYEYNQPVMESRRVPSGRYDPGMGMTTRPIIGVTMDHQDSPQGRAPGTSGNYLLSFDYCAAIEKAGGLPVAIPYRTHPAHIPQYVDLLDGILFTGGNDLDPALYGGTWHPKAVKIDPARQAFELALLAEVEKRRLPSLFVCLGCQLLNVYRGGSLTQFLPDDPEKLEHRRGETEMWRHKVQVDSDSQLGAPIGTQAVSANTYHKQAVKDVGRGLRIVAKAPDGVVEGLEDPSFPMMVAVQWHPERLTSEQEHLAPFRMLVEKAGGAKRDQESR